MQLLNRRDALLLFAGTVFPFQGCSLFPTPEPPLPEGASPAELEREILLRLQRLQRPDGSWKSHYRIFTTALAVRCFLEPGYLPQSEPYGSTVEAALDFLIDQTKQGNRAPTDANTAMDLRAVLWTLALAFGMTHHPELLTTLRAGLARLEEWNGRTKVSSKWSDYDTYMRLGFETLILLELRQAGFDLSDVPFIRRLKNDCEKLAKGPYDHPGAGYDLALHVLGIDDTPPITETINGISYQSRMYVLRSYQMEADTIYEKIAENICSLHLEARASSRNISQLNPRSRIEKLKRVDGRDAEFVLKVSAGLLSLPRPNDNRYYFVRPISHTNPFRL